MAAIGCTLTYAPTIYTITVTGTSHNLYSAYTIFKINLTCQDPPTITASTLANKIFTFGDPTYSLIVPEFTSTAGCSPYTFTYSSSVTSYPFESTSMGNFIIFNSITKTYTITITDINDIGMYTILVKGLLNDPANTFATFTWTLNIVKVPTTTGSTKKNTSS